MAIDRLALAISDNTVLALIAVDPEYFVTDDFTLLVFDSARRVNPAFSGYRTRYLEVISLACLVVVNTTTMKK